MSILSEIALPLVQIFMLIGLGYGMRRAKFPGDDFWPALEAVVYFILYPALLIHSLALVDLSTLQPLPVVGVVVPSLIATAAAIWLVRRQLRLGGPAFTSLFQGGIRFNSYIGIALVASSFGPAGVSLFAIIVASAIPIANILCVLVLARYANGGTKPSMARQARLLAQNPFILACVIGLALNLSGIGLPPPTDEFMNSLGRASLALGLMAVGAGLELSKLEWRNAALPVSCVAKFAILPLMVAGFAWAWGVDGETRSILLMWSCIPTASAAYILARQMGGDAPLMAIIISAQTLFAFAAIPLVMVALG